MDNKSKNQKKIKELCIVLKEFTAAFVGFWQNNTLIKKI